MAFFLAGKHNKKFDFETAFWIVLVLLLIVSVAVLFLLFLFCRHHHNRPIVAAPSGCTVKDENNEGNFVSICNSGFYLEEISEQEGGAETLD